MTENQIARLVTLWVCSSRHDMRQQVAAGNWNYQHLQDAGLTAKLDGNTKNELVSLYQPVTGSITAASTVTNAIVDMNWSGGDCPPTNSVLAAHNAIRENAGFGPI